VTISASSASPTSPHASDERPIFWIIAGPNGSGKSSLYDENTEIQEFGRAIWIINPDLLAKRIETTEGRAPDLANLEAVIRIEAWLEASIRVHQTVGVETVLSTGKYRRLVDEAKRLNFEFRLIYVLLDSPDRNVERVRLRVAKGGHDVPEDRIRARYVRSLAQLPWFLEQADQAWIFDNSSAVPKLIGQKRAGVITLEPQASPEIADAALMTTARRSWTLR
jgi:predicted ABC-type ATPase